MSKRSYPSKWFLFIVIIPVVVLLGMTMKPAITTLVGEDVMLQTSPADPRDLFYGDYVNLDFEVGHLPVALLSDEIIKEAKDEVGGYVDKMTVYVRLEFQNGIHQPKEVTLREPQNGTYLKGTLDASDVRKTLDGEDTKVSIDFGFNRYYVEENTGKQIEEQARAGQLIAKMRVKDGYGIITELKPALNNQ